MIILLKQELSYQPKFHVCYHLIYMAVVELDVLHLLQEYIVICIVKKRQDVAREAGSHVRNLL